MKLSVSFEEHPYHRCPEKQIQLEQLRSLVVLSDHQEDIECLVFHISFPKDAKLVIGSGKTEYTIASSYHGRFHKFPNPHLTSLTLDSIHLLQSFQDITTLTEFKIHHTRVKFIQPLDTIFTFMERNHALKHVELFMSFKNPPPCISKKQVPIKLEQLESLVVFSGHQQGIKCLISHISLSKGTTLKISPGDGGYMNLTAILPCIKEIAKSYDSMYIDYPKKYIKLSGPNRHVEISNLDHEGISSTLKEGPLPSFLASIQELHLIGQGLMPLNLSQFHNLKTLTVSGCGHFSIDFVEKLCQYAFKCNGTIELGLWESTATMVLMHTRTGKTISLWSRMQ